MYLVIHGILLYMSIVYASFNVCLYLKRLWYDKIS